MAGIVVGVDGSVASRNALDRALRLGQLTGRTVCVVHAWFVPAPISTGLGTGYLYDAGSFIDGARRTALDLLDTEVAGGLARLGSDRPVSVSAHEVNDGVGPAIVHLAQDADCVVLGTRTRRRVVGTLGSAVPYVLHHVTCPTIVIPEDAPPVRSFHRVVVGIDGSESSRSALRWAVDLARREGAAVVAVHAQGHARVVPQDGEGGWDQELDSCLLDAEKERVSLRVIRHRSAADALLAEAGGGDLLVVGSRGNGPVAGLVLGSVSAHCVAHAMVPVAVVRAHGERLDDLEGRRSSVEVDAG
jgi:nucleotide-binding universal stress UspA family protein